MLIRSLAVIAAMMTASTATAVPVQWTVESGGNGHYYEFLSLGGSVSNWTQAAEDAQSRTYLGMTGYLATVTSEAENAFLTSLSRETAYLGASDMEIEGVWKWMTGPEAGTIFYGPGAAPESYANWNAGEPNNSSNEDFLHMNHAGVGGWNDIGLSGSTSGYFVEYSADPVETPEPAALGLLGLGALAVAAARRRRG